MLQITKKALTSNLRQIARNFVRNSTASAPIVNENEDIQLKSWNEIPGPLSLPIFGQMLGFFTEKFPSDLSKMQEYLHSKYGPICKFDAMFGRPAMVFLFDPEAIACVLRAEKTMPARPGFDSLEYYRKYHNRTKEQSLTPTGLLTEHGDNWRYFRTKVNPVMLQPKTIQLYRTSLDEVADDMIKRMRSLRNEKDMINNDFNTEMNLWALESIGVVALGGRLNCLDPNLAEDAPARRLIECVHEIFKVINDVDFGISLWRYIPTKGFRDAMKVYEEQENLTKYFVGKAREEMLANKKEDSEKSILEKLLDIDENVAVVMASDMLFAGVDTVATTMLATLYLLAENQDKQDKLREEINSGNDSKIYLKACIKESMRMLPVASANMRQTTQEHNILGYKIPKKTNIILAHQQLSIIENQFPKAKEYIPERWIDKGELSHKSAHPFSYSPFGFGIRMCIGRRIAELEMEIFVTKVIQNFKVQWVGPPPSVKALSLNYLNGPFNFIFKDIK